MIDLFSPTKIKNLTLPNRLVRSATAERLADESGRPLPALFDLYQALADGGVGLVITGHLYIQPQGKAHPEMMGIYADHLIPGLAELTRTVHEHGGKIAAQINHAGIQAGDGVEPIGPSRIQLETMEQPAREMSISEIHQTILAYGLAAKRAKEAGFDAVQIHAAHGYLISQYLSPITNLRQDEWGGSIRNRMMFLEKVCGQVRQMVGEDFPVLIKLGMADSLDGGLSAEDGQSVVSQLASFGVDAIEISGGMGKPRVGNIRKGIRVFSDEAYFLPLALMAREATDLPIMLVGGFRSREVMDSILASGTVDFISMCRPLIREPDLPNKFKAGISARSACISANNCWPTNMNAGIACKCPRVEQKG